MTKQPRSAAFTMLELAIAIAIVALLVAVALGSYRESQAQKARVEAMKAMTDLADGLRRQAQATPGYRGQKLAYGQSPRTGVAQYQFSLATAPVRASDPVAVFPATTDLGFTLLATPVGKDACGVLLLDQGGRRGVTAGKVADCWH